jgi:AraC family transcriptional regulator
MQLPQQSPDEVSKIGRTTEALQGIKPLWSHAESRYSSLNVERFKVPGRMLTPRVQFENQHHVAIVWTGKVKENKHALRSMGSPNDTLILPLGSALEECTLSGVGFTDFAVSPSFLRQVACETDLPDRFELQPQWAVRDQQIETLARAAEYEINSGLRAGKLFMESLATALAAHLLARYSSQNVALREYRGGLSPYQLRLTCDFIATNLGGDFGLDDLAANVRMSPYYFCRLFKRTTHLSPHQFVIRERIQQARQLLEEHRLSMVEIASNLGFSDQSHFARVFRSRLGITPKQYSRQH